MSQFFAAIAMALGFSFVQSFHFNDRDYVPTTATWSCGDPAWVADPAIHDGKFVGELTGHCRIVGARGDGFAALEAHLLESAVRGDSTVNAGPASEVFDGLPSTYYDVTELYGSGGDKVTMRHDLHIATDVHSRLLHSVASKEIKASGFAGYLKKIDTALEVKPLDVTGEYDVRFNTLMIVERPWYVPGGLFKSKVKEIAHDRYTEGRKSILNDITPRI